MLLLSARIESVGATSSVMDLPVSVRTKICIEPLADARSRLPLPLESLLRGCAVLPPRPLSIFFPGAVVLFVLVGLITEDFVQVEPWDGQRSS